MKLKAIALIFLITLAHYGQAANLCHDLIKSRLKDIVNFELGEVVWFLFFLISFIYSMIQKTH